jgi:hypothetical protein
MNTCQLMQYGHLSENRLKEAISWIENPKEFVTESRNMLLVFIITVSITTLFTISRKTDSKSESGGSTVNPFDEFVGELKFIEGSGFTNRDLDQSRFSDTPMIFEPSQCFGSRV